MSKTNFTNNMLDMSGEWLDDDYGEIEKDLGCNLELYDCMIG